MASGSNNEPPPLPPPDYTPQSTEEFAKQRGPPLRGIIGDEAGMPSESEARKVFSKEEVARRRKEHEDAGLSPKTPRRPYIPGPVSRQPLVRPEKDETKGGAEGVSDKAFNPMRSSGTSQILNTAAAPTSGEVVNTMPGGTFHTAGGKVEGETSLFREATKDIKARDVLQIHQLPCVREALLQGMTAGLLVGAGRWILGRALMSCANWAVGTFVPVSVGGYQYCQYQRQRERNGMRAAVKIMDEKTEEKRKRMEERKEAAAKKREEEKRLKEEEEKRNRGRLGSMLMWWDREEAAQKEESKNRLKSMWKWWDGSEREEGRRREG